MLADLLEIAVSALTVDGGRRVGEHGGVGLRGKKPLREMERSIRDRRAHDHNGQRTYLTMAFRARGQHPRVAMACDHSLESSCRPTCSCSILPVVRADDQIKTQCWIGLQ